MPNYWKPIQAGELEALDSSLVKKFNPESTIFRERYLLQKPMSPHAAANLESISIELADFDLPDTDQTLIVEGAGGIMVPLNDKGLLIADIFKKIVDEVILVSKHYLGSINHTLLTIQFLKSQNIAIKGILFMGDSNPDTESIIHAVSGVNILGIIPWTDNITQAFIEAQAEALSSKIKLV